MGPHLCPLEPPSLRQPLHQPLRGSILEAEGLEKPLPVAVTDDRVPSPPDKGGFHCPCTPGVLQSRGHALSCLSLMHWGPVHTPQWSHRAWPGPLGAGEVAAAPLWSLVS